MTTNALGIDYEADTNEQIGDMGRSVTINGQRLLMLRGPLNLGREFEDAGRYDTRGCSYLVTAAALRQAPASGDIITDGLESYRIAEIDKIDETASLIMRCTDITAS
jgi:hypothetical protein